jgi:methyl-accepting chemotaxis protein
MAVKLTLLTGFGLLIAVAVGVRALGLVADIDRSSTKLSALDAATSTLNYLDHRMSELKADGFGVFVVEDPAALAEETKGDVATLAEGWGDLRRAGLPADVLDALDRLAAGQAGYGEFVQGFVADAAADPAGVQARAHEVTDKNRELDPLVDGAHAIVDKRLAEAHRHQDHVVAAARTELALTLVAGVALGALLCLALARRIVRPLRRVVEVLGRMADGDLRERMALRRKDELGVVATALDRMAERMSGVLDSVAGSAAEVAASSEHLAGVARQLGDTAVEASEQSSQASTSAEEVSASVRTVAAAAEEMGASIREIASSATEASRVAGGAVRVADATTGTVTKLGESSLEIGEVVKVITSIAEQTNLLALNATIEAARAGESGKGFAVVANEVKELAKLTASATQDIADRVTAIQGDAGAAGQAIAEVTEVIGRIDEIQATIASAVEEQTATTQEISRSVAEAATGATEIASNVSVVAVATEDTSAAAAQALRSAQSLASTAADLRSLLSIFTVAPLNAVAEVRTVADDARELVPAG